MGKKINPKIFRIKQTRTWDSRWFSSKKYAELLKEDILIKEFVKKKLLAAFVSQVNIERTSKDLNVIIYSARPGVIIGRGGVGIEELKKEIKKLENKIIALEKAQKKDSDILSDAYKNGQSEQIAKFSKIVSDRQEEIESLFVDLEMLSKQYEKKEKKNNL